MIQKYRYNNLTGVDADSPTKEEIVDLVKEHKLHALIGEDMLASSSTPRVEYHGDYIYLVLHVPVRMKVGNKYSVKTQEVDFVIGKDFLITTKYDTVEALQNFSKVFETNSIIDKGSMGEHAGFIFYYIIKKLYEQMMLDLGSMKEALLYAEEQTFAGNERTMVQVLSNLSRELIDLKQVSRLHKEIMDSFTPIAHTFFGEDFRFYVDDMAAEYSKIHECIGNNRELLNDLRETNDSLLTTKQNEVMKTLTVFAFVAFPLAIITGLFSIRASGTPFLDNPYGFEIIIAIMCAVALVLFVYCKSKKWL